MQVKINTPKVHNRFDVYRENVQTGVKQQVAYAENIILDTMWTWLCAGGYPFARIQYGTGTGSLSAGRTTLFTYLGYKAATLTERLYANPTSSLRQSIELGLTDNNGAVLTEVGIANSSGTLLTHAMLRDMNGNPVSIEKTAVDILTIYATLYAVIDDTHATLKMLSAANNGIVRQILGESGTGTQVTAGMSGGAKQYPTGLLSASLGTGGTGGTWTADVANKRRTLATPRFGVNDANGHIKEFNLGEIARLVLPATGIYAGLDIAGATVGAGDGVEDEFIMPSRNIDQATVVVKVDGATEAGVTLSDVENSRYVLTSYPTTSPGSAALSGDGRVMAQGLSSTPYLIVSDLVNDTWVARADPPNKPATTCYPYLSDDGDTLLILSTVAPYMLVYDWVDSTWTQRVAPTTPPTFYTPGGLSNDGLTVAYNTTTTPYFVVYDWVTSAWVKRADPASSPPSAAQPGGTLSADGLVYAVRGNDSVSTKIYRWNASAWDYRGALDRAYITSVSMTSDGGIIIITNFNTYYSGFGVYTWNGASYDRTIPAPFNSSLRGAHISQDGTRIIVGPESNALHVYELVGGTWTLRSALTVALGGTTSMPILQSRDKSICVIEQFTVVCDPKNTKVAFTTPPGLVTAEAVGTGDGSDATWDLDHTPITGSLVVKLDGATTTAYTLAGSTITFDAAPGAGVAITADYRYACSITADYTVEGIHKTTTRVIDLTFTVQFGEPV